MRVVTAEEAERELDELVAFYDAQSLGLGDAFIAEFRRVTGLLSRSPYLGMEVLPGVRRALLQRFPFVVNYRVEADHILVLVVRHQRRHPYQLNS